METLQPKIYKKTDCIAFTAQNHHNSIISYLPRSSGKLHKQRPLIGPPMRCLALGSFLKAEYLQKSFPKFLKIDAEKLILAGNDFKELTSNAKNLAENFRDNFDRYNHHFCP